MLTTTWNANLPGWAHSHLGEIWIYNEGIRSSLSNAEPGGGYRFVGCAAVANQLAAAWMWLAGTIPLSTVHLNSLLYFMLFYETHDLVLEIMSVSEKTIKNCIVNIIGNVFEKNDEGGLFPLTPIFYSPISSIPNSQTIRLWPHPWRYQWPLGQVSHLVRKVHVQG